MVPLTLALTTLLISQALAQSTYDLAVKKGDWVEYKVIEARNIPDVTTGDRMKLIVKGFNYTDVTYIGRGDVAFRVQVAVCDIYRNDGLVHSDVRVWSPFFFPIEKAFWQDFEQWLQDAKERGFYTYWNVEDWYGGYKRIYVEYPVDSEIWSYEAIIDMTAGVSVNFTFSSPHQSLKLQLYNTNIGGVSLPGQPGGQTLLSYWWVFLLIGVAVACAVTGALIALRRMPVAYATSAQPPSASVTTNDVHHLSVGYL